ncbi:3177_t:CDS:2 [Paraglomus brasilianum]|uniref:3177_t:CDS:1 n=1 Tax=Paraglomus brasilianum TaxID=144538 RepID=A0A9N9BMQ7_9GLOM|nr:3177_t:CDS:2 [Paraglomus brasilianum]
MTTFRIAGICGSLRKASVNKKLLLRAQQLCAERIPSAVIEIVDWSDIPVYNWDLEENPPESVIRFKNDIADRDAMLFITPEYNWSVPGPLKNALDWASRVRLGDRGDVFKGKAVAVMGASPGSAPGSSGSGRAQLILRQSFVSLNCYCINLPTVMVTDAYNAFNEDGSLKNVRLENNIVSVLEQLIALGEKSKS